MIIRNITGYQISKDYNKLWELAHKQSIVCICDYQLFDKPEKPCRDIAHTAYNGVDVSIWARGISYCSAEDKEMFIKICDHINVEWLIPMEYKRTVDTTDYKRAIEIAELWEAGKMFGYDPEDVVVALFKGIKRYNQAIEKLLAAWENELHNLNALETNPFRYAARNMLRDKINELKEIKG